MREPANGAGEVADFPEVRLTCCRRDHDGSSASSSIHLDDLENRAVRGTEMAEPTAGLVAARIRDGCVRTEDAVPETLPARRRGQVKFQRDHMEDALGHAATADRRRGRVARRRYDTPASLFGQEHRPCSGSELRVRRMAGNDQPRLVSIGSRPRGAASMPGLTIRHGGGPRGESALERPEDRAGMRLTPPRRGGRYREGLRCTIVYGENTRRG